MKYRSVLLYIALVSFLQPGMVVAQGTTPESGMAAVPQIGELIPDLEIVDDQGNPVRLRDLTRGHYTVMTLGCLT